MSVCWKTTDTPRRPTAQDCSQCACSVGLANAGGGHSHAAQQSDAVVSPADDNKVSSFDFWRLMLIVMSAASHFI